MKLRLWRRDRLERALELYESGLTYRQVGKRLGESKGTVERAVKKIRKIKDEENGD